MSNDPTKQFPAPQDEPQPAPSYYTQPQPADLPPSTTWAPPAGPAVPPPGAPKKMSTAKKVGIGVAVAFVAFIGIGVAGQGNTPTPAPAPAAAAPAASSSANFPTPTEDTVADTPSETPTPATFEGKFGETGSFTQDDVTFTVAVSKGVKAKCQYGSIGCDKPQTGDRFVNVPIVVKNTGSSALELTPDMFVLEFADGTRMTSTDGPTYQYGPDNTLPYDQKVRPGGTLKTSLTFEAPAGAYSIVLLTSSYGGEDLYIWK